MPKRVNVPGYGVVNFPDTMSDADIERALADIGAKAPYSLQSPGFLRPGEEVPTREEGSLEGLPRMTGQFAKAVLPAAAAQGVSMVFPQARVFRALTKLPGLGGGFTAASRAAATPTLRSSIATALTRGGAVGTAGYGASRAVGEPHEKAVEEGLFQGGAEVAFSPAAHFLSRALTPERLYQSALHPEFAAMSKESPEVIERAVGRGVSERLGPPGKVGIEKIDAASELIKSEKARFIKTRQDLGLTVDRDTVRNYLSDLKNYYEDSAAPQELLRAVDKVERQYLKSKPAKIPLDVAERIKEHTGTIVSKEYGELAGPKSEALKGITHGFKTELELIVPELKKLNPQLQEYKILKKAMEDFIRSRGISSSAAHAVPVLVGAATGGVEGSFRQYLAGSAAARVALGSSAFKTKLAFILDSLRKKGRLMKQIGPGALRAGKIVVEEP